MNVLDIILLILILAAAISGFTKGFFVELASILAIILGVWAGIAFSGTVQVWLSKMVDWSPVSIKLVAFIIIFLAVVVIVHLIANFFEKGIRAIALGIFSRMAGAVLGALKGAFILSVLFIVVTKIEYYTTTIIPEQTKKESKLYSPIEKLAPNIIPFLKNYKGPDSGKKGNAVPV
jgi:membrane protein required for colicin V production